MLETQRRNLKFSSYKFGINFSKNFGIALCRQTKSEWFTSMVQFKIKMFLGNALEVPEPFPDIEKRFEWVGKKEKCKIHQDNCGGKRE